MWPSSARGTRVGSQFGIWLATAVISPKVNDASPRRPRMRMSARRRSFRILRRRPFEAGSGLLRLRRSKRRILALRGVLDSNEGLTRGGVRSACTLQRDHHERPVRNGTLQWNGDDVPAVEQTRGPGRAAVGHPCLVGLARPGLLELPEDECALSV